MKKQLYILTVVMLISGLMLAQSGFKKKIEVLYFKANLACCKAKACNVLETDIKNIITKNYPDGKVQFTEVKLAADSSKILMKKYKAQSQTVIIVKHKKKKESSIDVSDLVKKYIKDQNKDEFEKALVLAINDFLK